MQVYMQSRAPLMTCVQAEGGHPELQRAMKRMTAPQP